MPWDVSVWAMLSGTRRSANLGVFPVHLASAKSRGLVPGVRHLLQSLMPPRRFVLAETNWKAVRSTPFEVAILPWGATEPHNFHLPYGTDTYETGALAEKSAEVA